MGFLKKFIFNRIADIIQIGEDTVIRLFIFVNVVWRRFYWDGTSVGCVVRSIT